MKRLVGIFASLALWLGCATTGVPGKADVAAEAPAAEAPAAEAPAAEAADSASTEDHAIAKASGPPLEPFSLKLASGGLYDAGAAMAEGKVLMISFWATWCGPCKTELERMAPVYDDLAGEGFEYLAVSADGPESVAEVRPYVRSCGYEFPVLLDTTGQILARYNPRGDLPFYILVNRKGEVVEEHQGFKPGDEVLLEEKVRSLLKAK